MKKIRNIKQLRREQQRLHDRQAELEKEMRETWKKLKKSMKPHNMAKDLASEWLVNRLAGLGIGRLLQIFS